MLEIMYIYKDQIAFVVGLLFSASISYRKLIEISLEKTDI